jgi:L-threonylcarbamoyladenylate synthase
MLRGLQVALERLLPQNTRSIAMDIKAKITNILPCDPSSITFAADSALPTISDPPTISALNIASKSLIKGEVVVFPTETVYGLAASALSEEATSQIFTIKGRPPDNPLIVHVSSQLMLSTLVPKDFVIPPIYKLLMDEFWPGALTLLFPCNRDVVPSVVTANHDTVAIRMPSHPVARALIAQSGLPLAAPSANTSGRPSPTKAEHVYADLKGRVNIILDGGPCDVGVESTVVDGLQGDDVLRVLRPGGVMVEQMEELFRSRGLERVRVLVHRRDYHDEKLESMPTTPGMKYRHYSPRCPVYLLMTGSKEDVHQSKTAGPFLQEAVQELIGNHADGKTIRIGLLSLTDSALTHTLLEHKQVKLPRTSTTVEVEWDTHTLGTVEDVAETARRLFDGLISLDAKGVKGIFVEGVGEEREGLAVMNRVQKAAGRVCWLTV